MTRLAKLQQLIVAEPNDAFVLYGLAQEYAKLGTDEGYRLALDHYDRCLAIDPNYLYAYYHKAAAMKERPDAIPQALEVLRTGIAAAKAARDQKALSELRALLDELE